MQNYIGIKSIKAREMNRLDYNTYRGWQLPDDEDGSDEGFLVEYVDSGKSNHPDHEGYISWSPKDVFERSHHITCDAYNNDIMKYFEYSHLPEKLQRISKPICDIAKIYDGKYSNSQEKSAGLRKLLEAKDCFVRAAL